jgi:hypothetical protein
MSEKITPDGPDCQNADVRAAVRDTEWLMRVRVRAAEIFAQRFPGTDEDRSHRPESRLSSESAHVLSGLLEDLQSAYDMSDDAFGMFALTYVLRRAPEYQGEPSGKLVEAALSAIAQAIEEDAEAGADDVSLYALGFIHGMSAAVKNIHMNA